MATRTRAVNANATPTAVAIPVNSLLLAISNNTKATVQGVFLQTANATFGCTLPLTLGGVQAPQRAGACNTVWVQYVTLLAILGAAPTVSQVLHALPECNPNNVKIEFYRAAKWVAAVPAYIAAEAAKAAV